MKKKSAVLIAFLVGMAFISFRSVVFGLEGAMWIKYSENPLNLGALNVGRPWVIYYGHMFRMWYTGVTDLGMDIYFANSTNGIDWTLHGVVLDRGDTGSWDDQYVCWPAVLFDGTTYRMWYVGAAESINSRGKVGYAISPDGISWTKYETNPVLIPGGNGGWDDWNILSLSVIFNGTHYRIWYGAQAYLDGPVTTGTATSVDGISWTKYSNNPVLTPGPSEWDSKHVFAGSVIMNNGHYEMWYTGEGYSPPGTRIGLATSFDGFSWSKYENNPVLSVGPPGSWDSYGVCHSCVVEKGSSLLMWYMGVSSEPGFPERIGLATSYIMAEVDIKPDTLNLRSKWITSYIELPEDWDVNDINVSLILLNDAVSAEPEPTSVGDYDGDGIPDLMVKFDRAEVIDYILDHVYIEERFTTVTLTITGCLYDGTPFQGSDTIKIIMPPTCTRQLIELH